jgi:hypothetical protein
MGSRQGGTKIQTPNRITTAVKMRQAFTDKKAGKGMSAEGRKRVSEAMKKRWAAQRKSA